MKLCRFETLESPGNARSGIVYGGKVYETDGANPIAVHEAADVRLFSPIGISPAVRLLRFSSTGEPDPAAYVYTNPASIAGPNQMLRVPAFVSDLDFEPYLACVIATAAAEVSVQEADGLILGLSILNVLVAGQERRTHGAAYARASDFAASLGPVLTTPDELDDALVDTDLGRRYRLPVVTRVNGLERAAGDAGSLPFTFAQVLSTASESWPLQPGEVFAMALPLESAAPPPALQPDDEIQVSVEHLGTLNSKVQW